MFSFTSNLFSGLFCLLCLAVLSESKSIESLTNRMNKYPAIISESSDLQPDIFIIKDRQDVLKPSSNRQDVPRPSSDLVRSKFLEALNSLPGKPIFKITKRNAISDIEPNNKLVYKIIDQSQANLSTVEELLELETIDTEKEIGCFIEFKIIPRIPGRCAIVDGKPVCKAGELYKSSNECSFGK